MTGRVAVTGATGFIGRHLVDSLLSAGIEARALSRRPEDAGLPAGVDIVRGSLEDKASLARLVEGSDFVVHCAGLIKARTRGELDRVNAGGTAALVEICAGRPSPPRTIFLSSLAARQPRISDYAASKCRAEQQLAEGGKALHWTVLRPPAVYGPGDRETLQVFRFLKRGICLTPNRDAARISLIYVSDLCDAIRTLLSAPIESGMRFEIRDACEEGYSWHAIAEAAGRYFDRRVTCVPVPFPLMRGLAATNQLLSGLTGYVPRISPGKVRELYHDDWVCHENVLARHIDWRPRVDLDEGIKLTLSWYADHGWL